MKRTIKVRTPNGVSITATIDSRGKNLKRDEVEAVRDYLADHLQEAASRLPYSFGTPRHRVIVR